MSENRAVAQLVAELRAEGAWLRLVDGKLRVKARPGVVTDERRAIIRANTSEIVALLATHCCTHCHHGVFPTAGVVCFRCRNAKQDPEAA